MHGDFCSLAAGSDVVVLLRDLVFCGEDSYFVLSMCQGYMMPTNFTHLGIE